MRILHVRRVLPLCQVALAIGLGAAQVVYAGTQAFPMPTYDAKLAIPESSTRVKISIALSEGSPQNSISLGDVLLCAKTVCYRAVTPNLVDLKNTAEGTALTIADGIVPYGTFTHVQFSERTGSKYIKGSIQLKPHLTIEPPFRRGEVFITLAHQGNAQSKVIGPLNASAAVVPPDYQSVFYDPKFPADVKLAMGAEMHIPAESLKSLQIFSVAVHNVGKKYPLVDVFPYIPLAKHASLTTPATDNSIDLESPSGAVAVPRYIPPPATTHGIRRSAESRAKTTFSKTGVFKSSSRAGTVNSFSTPPPSVGETPIIPVPPTLTCMQQLNDPAFVASAKSMLSLSGISYISACENSPPYVHIALINTHDPRNYVNLPYRYAGDSLDALRLYQMKTWDGGNRVMVNGFNWVGDLGMSSGGTGLAKGFVVSAAYKLGVNSIGGGHRPWNGADGNKRVMWWGGGSDSLAAKFADLSGTTTPLHINVMISSSTSVVRDNVCTTDTEQERWTAIGALNNITMLMSSTSQGQTNAREMCPVFKAFGINNAIRMDGSGSASMMLSTLHLNPLTGFYALKYGTMRYIPYPFRVSDHHWTGSHAPEPPPEPPRDGCCQYQP